MISLAFHVLQGKEAQKSWKLPFQMLHVGEGGNQLRNLAKSRRMMGHAVLHSEICVAQSEDSPPPEFSKRKTTGLEQTSMMWN